MERSRIKSEMETFHRNRFNYLMQADEDGELVSTKEDDIYNPEAEAAAEADREHFRAMKSKLKKIGEDTSEAKALISTFNSQMVDMKLDLCMIEDELFDDDDTFRDLTNSDYDVDENMHQDHEVEEEVRNETGESYQTDDNLVRNEREERETEEDQTDLVENDDNSG